MQTDASRRPGKQGSAVIAKRIFAGSLAVLLLCVSSFAAACDPSCGFAQFQSECHSPQTAPKKSVSPEMTMAGMTVPEMRGGSSTNQQIPYLFSAQGQLSPPAWAQEHESAFDEYKKLSGGAGEGEKVGGGWLGACAEIPPHLFPPPKASPDSAAASALSRFGAERG